MSLNPVDSAFTISTSSASATSSAFAHKTDSVRIVAIGNDAYVSIGKTGVDAGPTNFLVATGEPEIISLGHPRSNRVTGITTGSTTVLELPEGTGSPFVVGDFVTLTVTGQSGYDFTHIEVTAVEEASNGGANYVNGGAKITVSHDSSSGTPATLLSTSTALVRDSLIIAAEARTGSGSVHCQQVQVTG
jgi:hypothetical protein|tara:strand:- start:166 stop:732 length:567 start_codon:yes stop_codon:yes gene_type:complete